MLIILFLTLLISYFLISKLKGTNNSFFNLSFIITTPPLIGLIYYGIISKFDIPIGQEKFIGPIYNEISIKYCISIISFVLILSLIKYFNPSLLIVRNQNLPQIKTSFLTYLVFLFFESISKLMDISIHLKILFSEITNISLILLLSCVFLKLKANQSIYKFLSISSIFIIIYFAFTSDKGFFIVITSSIFLIFIGSKNTGLRINSLKTNIIILLGAFFMPFLNFVEQVIINKTLAYDQTFKSLTEAMESSILTNYYHVFVNPKCEYDQSISIFKTITSPLRALLGMNLQFHQHDFMETCFPLQRASGAGRGFGLITESAMSNELPTFLYFSFAAIAFILIFEFIYYRFSLFGLIVYSQSIHIIYKLTRSDVSSSIFSLIYTLIASYLVYKTILIINNHFDSFKKSY